jgi:hypothetical protein
MTEVKRLEFPKILDPRGNLTFIEYPLHLPFDIKRVFYTYDVPGGVQRGGHAYKTQSEVIIALSGSFDVVVTLDSGEEERLSLNRSYFGLLLPPLTWRHLENFSTNALGLHLSSVAYDSNDYVYDFESLIQLKNA